MQRTINVYLDENTAKRLDEAAKKECRSKSNFIAVILKQALTQLHATKDIKNIRIGVEEY